MIIKLTFYEMNYHSCSADLFATLRTFNVRYCSCNSDERKQGLQIGHVDLRLHSELHQGRGSPFVQVSINSTVSA